jgi:ATP/ADP translocase
LRPGDRALVWQLCGLAWLIFFGYGIANATAQSLYLQAYAANSLPTVWLAVAATSLAVVSLNNQVVRRVRVAEALLYAALCSAACFALLLSLLPSYPRAATFALYVCKDVYIVVICELFWTLANARFAALRAQQVYGFFCAAGSLGGVVGNSALNLLALRWGTTALFWWIVPVCLATALGVWLRRGAFEGKSDGVREPIGAGFGEKAVAAAPARVRQGSAWQVLRRSRTLVYLLLLVAVVQVALTVMDFQFNRGIEAAYADLDRRTALFGQVNAFINVGSLALQLGSRWLLATFGIAAVMLSIPLSLGSAVAVHLLHPSLISICCVKVVGKCVDYSLFRVAKEFVYIPLSRREKTEGKALIDMLTYRVAKGLASALLLGLTLYHLEAHTSLLSAALCVAWGALTLAILAQRRAPTP